jgi:dihydrolipoamide dehydrogenase/pyruvate dehydrogenase complex dihydrolipoamide acetyltransferase long form
MPLEIVMPKLGLTMAEGLIVEWKKAEGDPVSKGEILFVLETEKVTYDVESPEDGILGRILVHEEDTVPVGTVVALLLRSEESVSDLKLVAVPMPKERATLEPAHALERRKRVKAEEGEGGRKKASPYAKTIARSHGVDLRTVKGTGPDGMIIAQDVEKSHEAPTPPVPQEVSGQRLAPFSGMRRAIAKKMLASKVETAQTYMTNTVDASGIVSLRKRLLPLIQASVGVRITITDIMMKITAEAIRKHPVMNTRWTEAGVLHLEAIHMGMAMALDSGLIVPVIQDIEKKDLAEIAAERMDLIQKGKENRFLPDDIKGSTFTLSSLGMFGVEQFTANINLPENAILAVGAIMDKPVASGGEVVIKPMMTVTLSYDHRTIDGAEAGKFMQTLKELIEHPAFIYKTRITVIGGGVGGYPAAITASRMGAEVTLVERDALGGVCLNRGCVPTKSLIHSAELATTIRQADRFGIRCENAQVDFTGVMTRKQAVVEQLRTGVEKLLNARKIRVVRGTAKLLEPGTVQILETREKITCDKLIIASGSVPRRLPIEGADNPRIWHSDQFLEMEKRPESAVIIGGGVIGVEFAQILTRLGTQVTLLEVMDHLIPGMDLEMASALEEAIRGEGTTVFTNAHVERISHLDEHSTVYFTTAKESRKIEAERVIVSVGRAPDLSLLNIKRMGFACHNGALLVDERMETSVPGIYAVGDVVGGAMLAHVATAEGECAARNAMGEDRRMDYHAVPYCVYTEPEVASVGLTEEVARKQHDIEVGRFSFRGCGKAVILDKTYGMVKIISDKTDRKVLGVHMIGPHATDLIAEAVLGMSLGMTVDQLSRAIHPHPTLSEAVMETALSLSGGAIHMP